MLALFPQDSENICKTERDRLMSGNRSENRTAYYSNKLLISANEKW